MINQKSTNTLVNTNKINNNEVCVCIVDVIESMYKCIILMNVKFKTKQSNMHNAIL